MCRIQYKFTSTYTTWTYVSHMWLYITIYIHKCRLCFPFFFLMNFGCMQSLSLSLSKGITIQFLIWRACAGLKRTGKSCRLRWLNYLRPDVKRGDFTADEQLLILDLHSRWGNR